LPPVVGLRRGGQTIDDGPPLALRREQQRPVRRAAPDVAARLGRRLIAWTIDGLALSALYQQKVRTALTTLGVVIGTFVLILSLSIGQGVQRLAMKELRRHDQLRTIMVWPSYRDLADGSDRGNADTHTHR